jgi:hypothetical protein
MHLFLGASSDRIKFVTYATGWMKWLATEIADRDGNYRVLPLNVSALYASFSNVSSPRAGIVALRAHYWNSGSIFWLRVQSRIFRHQLLQVGGFIVPVSPSLCLSLIACPKPSTRCIAIILTLFFNQSVNILENIHGKQDVTQIVQFPVLIQTDLKRTGRAISSGRLSGCWPSIAAVPWRIKLLLELFM